MSAKVRGVDALAAKLRAMPPAIKQAVRDANQQNAAEFESRIASVVPYERGVDREHAPLVSTLTQGAGSTETAVKVSIGGQAPMDYAAHLEFGHMAKDGVHVPAEPFWFPTLRIMRARFRSRVQRAATSAIKKFVGATTQ